MQVFEILNELEKIKGDIDKAKHLKEKYSDHTPLKYLLKWNYCDTVKSLLPEGIPPFNDQPEDGPAKTSLWNHVNAFQRFVNCPAGNQIKSLQRENMFINILDTIDPEEARTICLAKDGNLNDRWPFLSVNIIRDAFPNLIVKSSIPVREDTPEEKAKKLMDLSRDKKMQAKTLTVEANKIAAEAKELLKAKTEG